MVQGYNYTKVLCDKCGKTIRDSRLEAYTLPTSMMQRKESITIGGKDICVYCCVDYLEELVTTTIDVNIRILHDIAQTEAKSKTNTLNFDITAETTT